MSRRPTLVHRLEYAAFRGALAVMRLLPERAAEAAAARIARLGYRPLRIRADHVDRNLARAFPDQSPAWRAHVARASYEHLGRELVAMMRLASLSAEEMRARTEIVDYEHVVERFSSGHGAVVIGGHFGNWEIGAAMMAVRGYPTAMVAQRQGNPLFDRYLVAARRRLGIDVIDRAQAPKLALRALRQQHIVVFGADQNAGRTGIFVPFFGHLASTHRGPAVMAVRTGAVVFVAAPLRVPGEDRWRLRLEEVEYDRAGDPDVVVPQLTAAFTARLEAAIRTAPDQYLWHHRRWKTRPPAESRNDGPAPDAAGDASTPDTAREHGRSDRRQEPDSG